MESQKKLKITYEILSLEALIGHIERRIINSEFIFIDGCRTNSFEAGVYYLTVSQKSDNLRFTFWIRTGQNAVRIQMTVLTKLDFSLKTFEESLMSVFHELNEPQLGFSLSLAFLSSYLDNETIVENVAGKGKITYIGGSLPDLQAYVEPRSIIMLYQVPLNVFSTFFGKLAEKILSERKASLCATTKLLLNPLAI